MKELTTQQKDILDRALDIRDNKVEISNIKKEFIINKFCKEFDYIVNNISQKYSGFINYEDLRQEGRIALMMAYKTYKPNSGEWPMWASYYIKTRISRKAKFHSSIKVPLCKAAKSTPFRVSLDDMSEFDMEADGNKEDGFSYTEKNETKKLVSEAINKLNEEEKVVLIMMEIKGYFISEVSEKLNITKYKCNKIFNSAKENFRSQISSLQ